MGFNENGVVNGNEAVFSKEPYGKGPDLVGMGFLRLALERTKTARDALDATVSLLEEHGQGGIQYRNSVFIDFLLPGLDNFYFLICQSRL